MKRRNLLLTLAVVALYALHQDIWFWRTARPLVFGFLPIGLFYHACFSVAAALLLAALVRYAWPGHLEDDADDQPALRASGIHSRERAGGPGGATQRPPAER
jgi:hypothetical protein